MGECHDEGAGQGSVGRCFLQGCSPTVSQWAGREVSRRPSEHSLPQPVLLDYVALSEQKAHLSGRGWPAASACPRPMTEWGQAGALPCVSFPSGLPSLGANSAGTEVICFDLNCLIICLTMLSCFLKMYGQHTEKHLSCLLSP